jgi:hypothetical protein
MLIYVMLIHVLMNMEGGMQNIKKYIIGVLSFCALPGWDNEALALTVPELATLRGQYGVNDIAEACLLNTGRCWSAAKPRIRNKFRRIRLSLAGHISSIGGIHFSKTETGDDSIGKDKDCYFFGNYDGIMKEFFDYTKSRKNNRGSFTINGTKIKAPTHHIKGKEGKVCKLFGQARTENRSGVGFGKVTLIGFDCDTLESSLNGNTFHPVLIVESTGDSYPDEPVVIRPDPSVTTMECEIETIMSPNKTPLFLTM